MTVAALYVETGGGYFGIPGVDPWDEKRDARLYGGPYPVVAHPPCSRWCQLARVNEKRWGAKVGDDGGCFAAALAAVQRWDGVLEHPAYSIAWATYGLRRPVRGRWTFCGSSVRGWVTEVNQSCYGHKARKRTWLYWVGEGVPPDLDWRDLPGTHWCGNNDTDYPDGHPSKKPSLGKREALHTPAPFRDLLISLATPSVG